MPKRISLAVDDGPRSIGDANRQRNPANATELTRTEKFLRDDTPPRVLWRGGYYRPVCELPRIYTNLYQQGRNKPGEGCTKPGQRTPAARTSPSPIGSRSANSRRTRPRACIRSETSPGRARRKRRACVPIPSTTRRGTSSSAPPTDGGTGSGRSSFHPDAE